MRASLGCRAALLPGEEAPPRSLSFSSERGAAASAGHLLPLWSTGQLSNSIITQKPEGEFDGVPTACPDSEKERPLTPLSVDSGETEMQGGRGGGQSLDVGVS